jgi:hypothetical protein
MATTKFSVPFQGRTYTVTAQQLDRAWRDHMPRFMGRSAADVRMMLFQRQFDPLALESLRSVSELLVLLAWDDTHGVSAWSA